MFLVTLSRVFYVPNSSFRLQCENSSNNLLPKIRSIIPNFSAPGFKLSSTLPKLSTIKSQDKAVSLLDFIVQQCVLLDGDCLKFVNDLEIVHSASQCKSNIYLKRVSNSY